MGLTKMDQLAPGRPEKPPSLAELFAASLKVGCLGFGGPAGQIALMHRVFVEERRWIDEARYLHALSFCTLLPGPEAQQLATYVGWSLRGVVGGLVAGLMFVLPGAVVMLGLGWLYALHGEAPLAVAGLTGVKAAVLALVVEALVRVGKRALKDRADILIAVAAFLALAMFGLPFPLVILAAAVVGVLRRSGGETPADVVGDGSRPPAWHIPVVGVTWGAVWLAPLGASLLLLGQGHWLTQLGAVFAGLAATSFGGAYALLTWLQQQAVETHGWIEARQMVDGLGLAETTPGPLVLVNQFVGFLTGWRQGGAGWALAGAAMALWQTFAPSFLYIFAGAPYADALRRNRAARGVLAAVMAAVLGVIGSLAVWFAAHVLFSEVSQLTLPWGSALSTPRLTSLDLWTAVLAVAAGVALIRFKANVVLVVLACAGLGLVRGLMA